MTIAATFLARLLQRDGPQDTPPPPAGRPEARHLDADLLLEESLSTAQVLALYKRAFMDVESVEGSDRLCVRTEHGVRLLVNVDVARRLVFFTAYFSLKAEAPMADKLALAHRANDALVLARYTVLDDTTLFADYQLPYDGGLPAALLMAVTRRLGSTMAQAMAQLDTDSVVG